MGEAWRLTVAPVVVERVLAAAAMGRMVAGVPGAAGRHVEIGAAAGGERVPIARLAWEEGEHRVVAVACFRGVHGVAPAYRELAGRLAQLVRERDPADCPTCRGTGWLPVQLPLARQAAALAVSMGSCRGVDLPRTPDLLRSVEAIGSASLIGLVG